MARKSKEQEIKEKLEYIGLNLEEVPETLKIFENLNYKPSRTSVNEKKYRQYRFISPKELDILLSPTNRLNDVKEKYEKSSPIINYLIPDTEENIEKHTKFLKMLKDLKIEDIEAVEEEQQLLNKKIPFGVKYKGNYLWQIYYSENADRYFMIVPTEDTDCSTFFYVLKKQLEKKKAGKIFVPISDAQYSKEFYNKQEIENIENYLWVLTKDWPSIYEVYDKNDKLSIHITGETAVYEELKTNYKVKIDNKIDATKFYKLLKALFILQTELPHFYNFETQIDKQGELQFFYNNQELKYDDITDWLHDEYLKYIKIGQDLQKEMDEVIHKLDELKQETAILDIEYISKEKQISTFLECKKSFFGKVKYFFKYSKKTKKKDEEKDEKDEIPKGLKILKNKEDSVGNEEIKKQYTIEELIEKGKQIDSLQIKLKNEKMDVNALKLRNKNLQKKIENAQKFIDEIDNHKKSIFEFWKYSNKDEMQALTEGEEEFVQAKPISPVFDYKDDLEEFGRILDTLQRKKLDKEELDLAFIATTPIIDLINQMQTEEISAKDLDAYLKTLKKELKEEKTLDDDEFDIFGGIGDNPRKTQKLANKNHREFPKDKFSILEIDKSTKALEFKMAILRVKESIQKSISKITSGKILPIYKFTEETENLDVNKINVFNINPELELEKFIGSETTKANLYKINIQKNTNVLAFTNSVYYDNQNKTLPIGMDADTRLILDLNNTEIKLDNKKTIRVAKEDDEKVTIKTLNILEYTIQDEKIDLTKQNDGDKENIDNKDNQEDEGSTENTK